MFDMKNDCVKALFLDLDGTFLDDGKNIPQENRDALKLMLDAGHKAIITTGRPLPSAVKQAVKLGLTGSGCYLIAYNGGVLYDTGNETVIFEKTLPLDCVYEINREARRRNMHIQAYDRESVLVEPVCDNDIVRYYCGRIEMPFRVIESMNNLQEEPAKLLLIDRQDKQKLENMRVWIRERYDSIIDTFFSCDEFVEVVGKHLNKGSGLIRMAEMLGIPVSNTIAVGDAENDLSMIEAAGTGCCMCNGSDEVKQIADYITVLDNNQGGVAEVIRRFILNPTESK